KRAPRVRAAGAPGRARARRRSGRRSAWRGGRSGRRAAGASDSEQWSDNRRACLCSVSVYNHRYIGRTTHLRYSAIRVQANRLHQKTDALRLLLEDCMAIRRSWCVFAFLLLLFSVAAHAAPVKLSTITISPGTVTGGTAATGTATLTGAAPHNGATVTLSSSNAAVAAFRPSIFIPQAATSATFSVTTSPVAA